MPTAAGMYYAQFDEGRKDDPPVILIHGAGSDHLMWPAEIRRLAGQRVVAVDLPGHGRSAGIAQQSVTAYADQMMAFFAEMGFYQTVLIGHGLGGAIALDLALRFPDQTAGLGLIATGAYLGVDAALLEQFVHPVMISSALHTFQTRAFGPGASPQMVERTMRAMQAVRGSVVAGDWRASAAFDLREAVLRIKAPAWVMVGSEDRMTPVAFAHFLADRLPAARLQIISGAGHMLPLEAPAAVSSGLRQFISALSAARVAAARVHLPTPTAAPIFQKKNTRS